MLSDFYKINQFQSLGNENLSATVMLNASHGIFEGHFPGNPITPGVCMLQIIKDIIEKEVGQALFIKEIPNVKFMAVVNPNNTPQLKLNIQISNSDGVLKTKTIGSIGKDTIALKCNCNFTLA